MKRKIRILLITLFWTSSRLLSQDTLTLDQAIQIGLENNFSIVLAKYNQEIAQNNNTWEYVLPTLGVNASQTNNITNSKQTPFVGAPREGTGLKLTSLNASALLNWTIFDGFYMFVTKDKLEEFERLGETQTRLAIEDVISRIVVSYYGIVLQRSMLDQMKEVVSISQQRKKLVESRYRVGTASELALMQAQADLNADSSALIKQEIAYKNAQADLNELLAREPNIPVNVSRNISIDRTLTFDNLNEKVKSQNTELLIAKQNERIAELSIDQARSDRYPQLNLFGGYNYTRNTAAIGFAQLTRSYGPTYGATFSWNIYGAGVTKRNVQNAKVQRISQQVQRQDLESQLNNELYKMYNQYQVNIGLVDIEQKNMKVTEKNVAVALERYKLGAYTDLELKDVQSTFLDASSRLLTTLYQAKQSETELLRMSGQLVK